MSPCCQVHCCCWLFLTAQVMVGNFWSNVQQPFVSLPRRNTSLRTTLCLPCGLWFWSDRHWRATRLDYSPSLSPPRAVCLLVSLQFPVSLSCRWQTWCKKRFLTFWNTGLREGRFLVCFFFRDLSVKPELQLPPSTLSRSRSPTLWLIHSLALSLSLTLSSAL